MAFVAVVGSRDYPRPEKVKEFVSKLPIDTIVVSGGARGVDSWAAEAAQEAGLEVEEYLPEWDKYGRSAGFRRNKDIEENADRCIAFWDGKSRGTRHTMELFLKAGKSLLWCAPWGEAMEIMSVEELGEEG